MNIQQVLRSLVAAWLVFSGSTAAYATEMAPTEAQAAAVAESVLTINVNSANAEELADLLDGVGLSRAQAIIEYREQHGPFRSAQELIAVRGIGQATLEKNLAVIRVQ